MYLIHNHQQMDSNLAAMKVYFFLLLVCQLFFSSCSNEVEKTIQGSWSIDTIYYKNYDVRSCMYVNIIDFNKDGGSSLPYTKDRCNEIITKSDDENGYWEIIKSENPKDTIPLRIKITTNNKLFSGIHKIIFHKDQQNELLKMEIWSDSLYIICRKGLYNFHSNIETINELERLSWTTRPK